MQNRVSLKITPANLNLINQAIAQLSTTLQPMLISLTDEERKALPKLGDGSVAFVIKSLAYAKSNPNLAPPYLDVQELEKDVELVNILVEIHRPLAQVVSMLEDTIDQAGSEAYVGSLSFYGSVQSAAKKGIKGAKSIYEDLKQRFASFGRKKKP